MEIKKRKYISIFFSLAFFFASVILAISSCYNEVDIDSFPSSKLTSIQITNMPDKLVYQMNDTLDTSGLIITASYKSGNQKEIPQKVEGVEVGWVTKGFDSTQHVSQQTVFITYEENGISRFTSYTITYKNLTAISITTVPDKKIYQMGDSLDTTGMEITASYEDGTSGLIALNDPNLTFSGFDSSVNVSSQTIYVTYKTNNGQRSAQFTIQYKNLAAVRVTTKPEKDQPVMPTVLLQLFPLLIQTSKLQVLIRQLALLLPRQLQSPIPPETCSIQIPSIYIIKRLLVLL